MVVSSGFQPEGVKMLRQRRERAYVVFYQYVVQDNSSFGVGSCCVSSRKSLEIVSVLISAQKVLESDLLPKYGKVHVVITGWKLKKFRPVTKLRELPKGGEKGE